MSSVRSSDHRNRIAVGRCHAAKTEKKTQRTQKAAKAAEGNKPARILQRELCELREDQIFFCGFCDSLRLLRLQFGFAFGALTINVTPRAAAVSKGQSLQELRRD